MRPDPILIHRRSSSFASSSSSLHTNPKEFRNSIINSIKKLRPLSGYSASNNNKNTFKLEPIEDYMQEYRKGFELRSEDSEYDFENIINYGFGVHENELQLTLKLSLTPNQIRNSSY